MNHFGVAAAHMRDLDQRAMERTVFGQPRDMDERLRPGRGVAPAEEDRPEQAFEPSAHARRPTEMIGMRPAGDMTQRPAAIIERGGALDRAAHRPPLAVAHPPSPPPDSKTGAEGKHWS